MLKDRYDWAPEEAYERVTLLRKYCTVSKEVAMLEIDINIIAPIIIQIYNFSMLNSKEWIAARSNPNAIWSRDSYGEETCSLLMTSSASSSRRLEHQKAI